MPTLSFLEKGIIGEIAPRWFWPILAAILVSSSVLRLWDLTADPFRLHLGGVEVDEGFWIHNARLAALNIPLQDDLVHAEAAGPLASRLIRLSFEWGGVNFATARLPCAISGIGLVIIMTLFAYTAWGKYHALVAAYLAGFADVLVIYSRLAVVEGLVTVTLGIALMLLVHPTKRFHALAGTAASVALMTKITSVYYFPGLLAVVWIMESGRARWIALSRFILGFVFPTVWIGADWFANLEQNLVMIKAAADYFEGYDSIRARLTTVIFNKFFGMASSAVLLAMTALMLMEWKRLTPSNRALLLYIVIFLLCFLPSPDHAARRCIPLAVPLILIAVPRLLGSQEKPSLYKIVAAALSYMIIGLAILRGYLMTRGITTDQLVNSIYCLSLAVCVGCLLLAGLNSGFADRNRRRILVMSAIVFALPAIVGFATRTHSLYETSRSIAQYVGRGTFVVGSLAHTLSLEGEFYPVFYHPRARGLSAVNSHFDLSKIGYQLFSAKGPNWAPLGLGFDTQPERLAVYGLFPESDNEFKWQVELYRLRSTNAGFADTTQ